MPVEGKAKIRHVGAWAVSKVFHAKLKYVKLHMTSRVQKTQVLVRKSLAMSGLLEEYVIANFSQLQQTSEHQDTLMVTEERQYRGILVYNICLVSISKPVFDGVTNKSVLNIERS